MNKMTKFLCSALAVAFTALPLSACKEEDGIKTLQINEVTHSVFSAPLYLADSLGYFEEENDAFVVCTYSSLIDSEVVQDSLFVYIVMKDEQGYYLEIPHLGVSTIYGAVIPLHNDYTDWSYKWHYTEYKNTSLKHCYGFAFKNETDDYDLYFDDHKMNEFKCVNPFTEQEFVLCYAVSDKVYNFFEMIFVPMEDRHTLEIK